MQILGRVKQESINKILVLQKKALRYMQFKSKMEHSAPIFLQAKILPIELQLILRNCLFALEVIQKDCPTYFTTF